MTDADDTARLKAIPKEGIECPRCAWMRDGKSGDQVPEHHQACPFRDSEADPSAQGG